MLSGGKWSKRRALERETEREKKRRRDDDDEDDEEEYEKWRRRTSMYSEEPRWKG